MIVRNTVIFLMEFECLNTEAAKIVSGATNLAYSERPVREVDYIL